MIIIFHYLTVYSKLLVEKRLGNNAISWEIDDFLKMYKNPDFLKKKPIKIPFFLKLGTFLRIASTFLTGKATKLISPTNLKIFFQKIS